MHKMKFSDVPINTYFFDIDGDLCLKVDSTSAKTPYCAQWFTAGFMPNENVTIAVKE